MTHICVPLTKKSLSASDVLCNFLRCAKFRCTHFACALYFIFYPLIAVILDEQDFTFDPFYSILVMMRVT